MKRMEGHCVIKCKVKDKDSGLLGCGAALIGKWFCEPWTLEDEGDMYFRNVRSHLSSKAVSHPGRPESFVTLFWKPQTSQSLAHSVQVFS
jgi:hypothetical protein